MLSSVKIWTGIVVMYILEFLSIFLYSSKKQYDRDSYLSLKHELTLLLLGLLLTLLPVAEPKVISAKTNTHHMTSEF